MSADIKREDDDAMETDPAVEAPTEGVALPSEQTENNPPANENDTGLGLDGAQDDMNPRVDDDEEDPDQQARQRGDEEPDAEEALPELRIPLQKDISLREFLSKMDDYAPIIPDVVTNHALTLAGLPPPPLSSTGASSSSLENTTYTPLPLARLLALATQKFIADIAADAYQYSRMRSGNLTSNTLSAMANPGAGGAQTSNAVGTAATSSKNQPGQHVLGVQRPGFGGGGSGGGQGRAVLTMEDLGMAVGEYGVNIKRGEFYR